MKKNTVLAVLVSLNLLLLVGLVLTTSSPQAALAQSTSLSSNYMVVAGEIQDQHDALYMLDTRSRKLYGFEYSRSRKQLELIAGRDLKRDFRNEGD